MHVLTFPPDIQQDKSGDALTPIINSKFLTNRSTDQ
jgi:hypothetical protein